MKENNQWYHQSIAAIVARLVDAGLPISSFVGCTKDEVDYLESKYSCKLPLAYRVFLEIMGKSPGPLFGDVTIEYEFIDEVNRMAEEVIKEEGYSIPENRFIYSTLMGQAYAFFDLDDDSDDPRYYTFHEDDGVIARGSNSFVEMLERQADLFIRYKIERRFNNS